MERTQELLKIKPDSVGDNGEKERCLRGYCPF